MNKSELVDKVAAQANLTKVDASAALDAAVNVIMDAVAAGDTVTLVGFGSFKAAARAAREGRNPKTGESMTIPAGVAPKFSAGATFKAKVNK